MARRPFTAVRRGCRAAAGIAPRTSRATRWRILGNRSASARPTFAGQAVTERDPRFRRQGAGGQRDWQLVPELRHDEAPFLAELKIAAIAGLA